MVEAIKAARFADQIRDYVASWSSQDLPGYFFSLTAVTLNPSGTHAVIWVDCYDLNQSKTILSRLSEKAGHYKRRLHQTMQKQHIPDLSFRIDSRTIISLEAS